MRRPPRPLRAATAPLHALTIALLAASLLAAAVVRSSTTPDDAIARQATAAADTATAETFIQITVDGKAKRLAFRATDDLDAVAHAFAAEHGILVNKPKLLAAMWHELSPPSPPSPPPPPIAPRTKAVAATSAPEDTRACAIMDTPQPKRFKVLINSHVAYKEPRARLLAALRRGGIAGDDIVAVIGGDDVSLVYRERIPGDHWGIRTTQNSIDFTALVEVLENEAAVARIGEPEYWLVLHDTVLPGSETFFDIIARTRVTASCRLIAPFGMNMGWYKASELKRFREEVLYFKGNRSAPGNRDLLKRIGVAVEDLFFRVSGRLEFLSDRREVRATGALVYDSRVPRTVEYYPELDLLKFKANAEAKPGEYEYI